VIHAKMPLTEKFNRPIRKELQWTGALF
jgi:hypothetical protein